MSILALGRKAKEQPNEKQETYKYPGTRVAMDGNTAAMMCERESTDAAGAYPITPSTQMGEYWAEAAAAGHINISGRPLIFIEPEGEHAAAAVTAGLSMTGLRAANFSSGQGIAYMHESLYAAVGKRLTYILNIGARAMTKATLNVHAGHDDYHCMDDTGFFQLFAKNAQMAGDLNIIAHRIAELALTPGAVAQDGFLTTHLIESMMVPERELIAEYLGRPDDIIETPTPAQRIIYGEKRRRIPQLWDVDNPVMAGLVQNQDSYMQSVAAQRPFFFDHIQELADRAFREFAALTGRDYRRVMTYRADDADYLILGQGSMIPTAEAVVDYLRETRGVKVGVVDMVMFRPYPGDLVSRIIKGKKGVAVLERLDQPLAVDLPLMRELRATIAKSVENGRGSGEPTYEGIEPYGSTSDLPALYSGSYGMGSRDLQPEGLVGTVENMLPDGKKKKLFYLSIDFIRDEPFTPKQEMLQQVIEQPYPNVKELSVRGSENPNLMPENSITVRFHSVGGWGAITTGKNLAMTLFDLLGYHIKANPKYGSEKKGQPTTYYLSAAPEPIRVNCEYFYVDVVLSPDPNVFQHTNALAGLKEGGVFIIQSELGSPQEVWESIPPQFQKIIIDKKIKVFYLDGFKIAREEATDPDLQLRMQGIAFQGAFFACSPVAQQAGLSEAKLLDAIHDQLQDKFGSKGARVVEDNMRVVKRGWDENQEVIAGEITQPKAGDEGGGRRARDSRHGQAAAPEQGADDRHSPLLGTDRKLLRPGHGQRQHHRSVHRTGRDAGLHGAVPRHDRNPLRASRVGSRGLHRLRQVLHGLPRHRDSGSGQRGRSGPRHRRRAGAQERQRRQARAPAQGRSSDGAQPARPARRSPGERLGRRHARRGDHQDDQRERPGGRGQESAAEGVRDLPRGAERLPLRPHAALLHASRERPAGLGRPALDHRQSPHLQGLHGVRGGL